jgi:hydrogenase nickel incorporation protein HypA/HybF
MHEMSLVRNLISQVQSIVRDNQAESAEEVLVEVGPLAGVEIELVKSAFTQLGSEGDQGIGKLTIHSVPLVIRCRDCDGESELNDFVFRCPVCKSGHVQVIRGDEFRLVSITLNETHSHA